MMLTRTETCIQLTYTLEEYKEFNHAIVAFSNEIAGTLRNEIPGLQDEDKEYFETLNDDFIHTLILYRPHDGLLSYRDRHATDLQCRRI